MFARRALSAVVAALCLSGSAFAAPTVFDIPAQPLAASLKQLASTAGITVAVDTTLVTGRNAPAVKGTLEPAQALRQLLVGSGLEANPGPGGGFVVQRAALQASEQQLPEVRVQATGQSAPGELPKPYAGGQVARGGRVGFLGDLDVFNTPFSVQHYTRETLQNQQVANIGDALINDPSVQSRFPRNGLFDQFEIRGFTVFAGDVFFNGLPGVVTGGGAPTMAESLERIDLIKGPNTFLSGVTGNVGGRVNLVPKRGTDTPLAEVTFGYSTESVLSGHLDVGRRFGPDNAVGIRFNAVKRKGTAADEHKHESDAYAVALDYRGERFRAAIDLGKQEQLDTGGSDFVLINAALTAIPDPPREQKNVYQPWATSDFDNRYYAFRAELDVTSNWTAHLAVGGRDEDYTRLRPIPQLLSPNGAFATTPAFGVFPAKTFAYDTGVRGSFTTGPVGHTLQLNVTQFEAKSGFRNTNLPPAIVSNFNNPVVAPPPSTAGLPTSIPYDTRVEQPSVGIADIMSFAEGDVLLMLGLRRQKVETYSLNAATGAETTVYDKGATTPSIGVVVKPWKQVSLYASYIEGLTQGPTAPVGTVNAGEIFPPFASRQVEVGAKADLSPIALTAALFRITQPSATTDLATNRFGLDGEQQNTGLELGVFGEVARGVRLLGGVTFLDGKLKRTANGTNDGKTAVGTPEVQVSLGTEWDVTALPGLTLTGRVINVGSQFVNAPNTLSIPSWTRWDVGARYSMTAGGHPITLRAHVENLFDHNYWSSASRGFLSFGAPRTVVVSATLAY